jgi:O-antigen/teichoic acid export membrane protein
MERTAGRHAGFRGHDEWEGGGAHGASYNFVALSLRVISVGGKLLLVLYVGKYLSLADLGVYGLFSTTVLLAIYLVGFDFYTFAARELLARPAAARPALLRDQLVCHLFGYALLLPALLLVFFFGFLPWALLGVFYWVLVTTHLCQEIHRTLITLAAPISAYAISAIAHGLWTVPVIVLGLVHLPFRSLPVVLSAWALCATLGLGVGAFRLRQLGVLPASRRPVDWRWIARGLAVSWKFFLSSLSLRGVEFSNRYFIHYFFGDARVGAYTLFASIANTLHDFTVTVVAAPAFAPLVTSFQRGDLQTFRLQLSRLRKGLVRSSLILLPLFAIATQALVMILERPTLRVELPCFYLLLAGAIALNLSLTPHYTLYVRQRDELILSAGIFAILISIATNVLLVPTYGATGAGAASLLAMMGLGLSKHFFVTRGS